MNEHVQVCRLCLHLDFFHLLSLSRHSHIDTEGSPERLSVTMYHLSPRPLGEQAHAFGLSAQRICFLAGSELSMGSNGQCGRFST